MRSAFLICASICVAAVGVARAEDQRQPLYYQDPDGKPFYASGPKKAADGRDYKPVLEDVPAAQAAAGPAAPLKVSGSGDHRVLYYRNPMGLPDTSPAPKKDAMGMDYLPVYADEAGETGIVKINPERIQTLGVRTEAV